MRRLAITALAALSILTACGQSSDRESAPLAVASATSTFETVRGSIAKVAIPGFEYPADYALVLDSGNLLYADVVTHGFQAKADQVAGRKVIVEGPMKTVNGSKVIEVRSMTVVPARADAPYMDDCKAAQEVIYQAYGHLMNGIGIGADRDTGVCQLSAGFKSQAAIQQFVNDRLSLGKDPRYESLKNGRRVEIVPMILGEIVPYPSGTVRN